MTLLLLFSGETEVVPVPAPIVTGQPMVRAFLAERETGDLLAELRKPTWTGKPTWGWEEVGSATCTLPNTDPGLVPLERDDPVKPWHTWESKDVELVVYRRGVEVWGGPVVKVTERAGRVEVSARTREFYPLRAIPGDAERNNHLEQGYFDTDPDLSEWAIGSGMTATTTTTESLLWRRDRALRLTGSPGSTMNANHIFDAGEQRNSVRVVIPVRLDEGAEAYLSTVAIVDHYTALPGSGIFFLVEQVPVLLPSGTAAEEYVTCSAAISQHANKDNNYVVRLLGGYGAPITYGEVELLRNENMSALAGWDVALIIAALYEKLTDRMGHGWTRHVQSTGTLLSSSVRYLLGDHEQTRSILEDWADFGTWWVERTRLRWGQRGVDAPFAITEQNFADWEVTVDAEEAATEVIAQSAYGDGVGREEAGSASSGPNLLSVVEQAPWDVGLRDLEPWTDRRLVSRGPVRTLTGRLASKPGESPGEFLHTCRIGDRAPFALGRHAGTVRVRRIAWDPKSDRPEVLWEVLDAA